MRLFLLFSLGPVAVLTSYRRFRKLALVIIASRILMGTRFRKRLWCKLDSGAVIRPVRSKLFDRFLSVAGFRDNFMSDSALTSGAIPSRSRAWSSTVRTRIGLGSRLIRAPPSYGIAQEGTAYRSRTPHGGAPARLHYPAVVAFALSSDFSR